MTEVTLSGILVCRDRDESDLVAAALPAHVALTRAESGCREFDVRVTADPLVWTVSERFADAASFRSHQQRVATSEWGRATVGIERRYTVSGLESD